MNKDSFHVAFITLVQSMAGLLIVMVFGFLMVLIQTGMSAIIPSMNQSEFFTGFMFAVGMVFGLIIFMIITNER